MILREKNMKNLQTVTNLETFKQIKIYKGEFYLLHSQLLRSNYIAVAL